jgi:GLPGLI family protein
MKKILVGSLALLTVMGLQAQQKEGKVIYQRSVEMRMVINSGDGPADPIVRTRTDKFELNFANGKMILRQMEDDLPPEGNNEGGMIIRTMGAGADDITYCDLDNAQKLEQKEFFDKKYLVGDSIRRGNWKLSEDTKTILSHICRKAVSQRIGKKTSMSMENGKMERKEIADTSEVVAWFTTDIPVSAGPEMQGQLPGLILGLETNNGKTVYTALEVSPKADLAAIKEPTKGKKVTPDEFAKERSKMLDEMQKNGGGTFRMRM